MDEEGFVDPRLLKVVAGGVLTDRGCWVEDLVVVFDVCNKVFWYVLAAV